MGRRNNEKLTPEVERQFLYFVQMSLCVSEAAMAVGVTPQAISMRRKRDPEFDRKIRQAEAKCEMGLIARIQQAVERGEWRAALALLERRWPGRWGRAEARDANEAVSAQDIVEGVHKLLAAVGARHAPPDAKDVDADESEPLPRGGEPS